MYILLIKNQPKNFYCKKSTCHCDRLIKIMKTESLPFIKSITEIFLQWAVTEAGTLFITDLNNMLRECWKSSACLMKLNYDC